MFAKKNSLNFYQSFYIAMFIGVLDCIKKLGIIKAQRLYRAIFEKPSSSVSFI